MTYYASNFMVMIFCLIGMKSSIADDTDLNAELSNYVIKKYNISEPSDRKLPNLMDSLFKPFNFSRSGPFTVWHSGMSTDSRDGYSKRIRFLSDDGNCTATGNIYYRDSARSAFHKLFTTVSNSSAPVPLFAISLAFVKDGPGDLCFVHKIKGSNPGETVLGKSTIFFSRGNVSVYLRTEKEEMDMFPIAKEMDAMIVAAMAKAEVAAKEKAEKDKAAAAESARLAHEAATKAATEKAKRERELNKW